ncbi:Putative ZapE-like AFG1-like ATPase [Candidatus Bealeia paramacronuclearis]|uniref:ZapE-like AFG1-like ATPase n=2 Tax=Candidatus Bealeia paramacronuclearis TaxID=1921001 RepID=A0ABZ2C5B3_9PROT|nr:putative ZapE-like AFG1-like ATPase [Candidatus Bealeia paramacronuclearis]
MAPSKWSLFKKKSRKIKGIYLWGSVGRGKTCLMDLFYDSVSNIKKERVHFHAFMQEIHARISQVKSLDVVADEISNRTQVLCFDEFQVTNITDAMIMSRFFRRLFERDVVMVMTSNVEPSKLYENGLSREHFLPFIALLSESLEILHIKEGKDYRRGPGERFFYEISTHWDQLTQDATESTAVLKKGQRSLVVEKSKGDYAWFSFADLCARPLGVRDYLLLSQNYKGVFIDHIPELSSSDRNEAHRLMALVDVLYERKIPLYYNATVSPDLLYPEGEGAKAFERTASRLYEMRKWYKNYDQTNS